MQRKKGFTLVELLVVIGIIAVLISMLLPALNKVRQAAWRVACQSQMKQIAMGMLMYANANQQSLPSGFARAVTGFNQVDVYNVDDNWAWLIAPYLSTSYGTQSNASDGMVQLFTCPGYYAAGGAQSADFIVQRTYLLSEQWDSMYSMDGARPYPWYGVDGLRLTRVKRAPEKALLFDIYWFNRPANVTLYRNTFTGWCQYYDNLFPLLKPGVVTPYNYLNKAPHTSGDSYGANVAFVDGHVDWIPYDQNGHLPRGIFYPTWDIK